MERDETMHFFCFFKLFSEYNQYLNSKNNNELERRCIFLPFLK